MGTGPHAVLSIALKKYKPCFPLAADCNPEFVRLAKENILNNTEEFKVAYSNLFENLPESFDTVIFNSPYIPTVKGEELGIAFQG